MFTEYQASRVLLLPVAAVLLVACSSPIAPVLPEGQIQLESGNWAPQPESTEGGQAAAPGLPMIRPGSPNFHASRPEDFVLASGQVQLVEFFAYWCAVCKAVAPMVHGLETIYGDEVNFVYLDRDDPSTVRIQEQLGYTYQPHFFLLDPNGAVLAQWRGFVDAMELQRALVMALATSQ